VVTFQLAIAGPRSFPPILQGKALRLQTRIHAMPLFGGQPLPRRLRTCPALAAARPGWSPIRHVVPGHRLYRPVGFIVAFLRRSGRSRSGAGGVVPWSSRVLAGRCTRQPWSPLFGLPVRGEAASINHTPRTGWTRSTAGPEDAGTSVGWRSVLIGLTRQRSIPASVAMPGLTRAQSVQHLLRLPSPITGGLGIGRARAWRTIHG